MRWPWLVTLGHHEPMAALTDRSYERQSTQQWVVTLGHIEPMAALTDRSYERQSTQHFSWITLQVVIIGKLSEENVTDPNRFVMSKGPNNFS